MGGFGSGGFNKAAPTSAPATPTVPTVDATSVGSSISSTTIGWTHNAASGVKVLLVVLAYVDFATTVNSLTYGAASLTQLESTHHSGIRIELWTLTNPSGGPNAIAAVLSTSEAQIVGGAATYYAATVAAHNSASGISETEQDVVQTSAAGHLVFSAGSGPAPTSCTTTSNTHLQSGAANTQGLSLDQTPGAASITAKYTAVLSTMGAVTADLAPA